MLAYQAKAKLSAAFKKMNLSLDVAEVKGGNVLKITAPDEDLASLLIATFNHLFPGKTIAFGDKTDGLQGKNVHVYLDPTRLTNEEIDVIADPKNLIGHEFPIEGESFGKPYSIMKPPRIR